MMVGGQARMSAKQSQTPLFRPSPWLAGTAVRCTHILLLSRSTYAWRIARRTSQSTCDMYESLRGAYLSPVERPGYRTVELYGRSCSFHVCVVLIRGSNMQRENVYKHFRFTPKLAVQSMLGLIVVPGLIYYIAASTDVRWFTRRSSSTLTHMFYR